MTKPPQIVAMGGGGFLMEPENLLLDRFILSTAATAHPRVCFVGTASGDAASFSDRFYAAFRTLDCVPTELSLFKPPTADLRSYVFEQNVIYVGGGKRVLCWLCGANGVWIPFFARPGNSAS